MIDIGTPDIDVAPEPWYRSNPFALGLLVGLALGVPLGGWLL